MLHRQGLVATASGRTPMQTLFPLCSLTLRRPEEEEEVDSKAATVGRGLEYELCVQQVCLAFPGFMVHMSNSLFCYVTHNHVSDSSVLPCDSPMSRSSAQHRTGRWQWDQVCQAPLHWWSGFACWALTCVSSDYTTSLQTYLQQLHAGCCCSCQ